MSMLRKSGTGYITIFKKRVYTPVVFIIFSMLIFSCATIPPNTRALLDYKKNRTIVLIPTYVKNDTKYPVFASYRATIINRETKKRIKDIEIRPENGYTLIVGLPPGKYAFSHIKPKHYSNKQPPLGKPYLATVTDVFQPFNVKENEIVATGLAYITYFHFNKKLHIYSFMMDFKDFKGNAGVAGLKKFFSDYPEYNTLYKDKIEVGTIVDKNGNKEIRYWNTKEGTISTIIVIPSKIVSGSSTYSPTISTEKK